MTVIVSQEGKREKNGQLFSMERWGRVGERDTKPAPWGGVKGFRTYHSKGGKRAVQRHRRTRKGGVRAANLTQSTSILAGAIHSEKGNRRDGEKNRVFCRGNTLGESGGDKNLIRTELGGSLISHGVSYTKHTETLTEKGRRGLHEGGMAGNIWLLEVDDLTGGGDVI